MESSTLLIKNFCADESEFEFQLGLFSFYEKHFSQNFALHFSSTSRRIEVRHT